MPNIDDIKVEGVRWWAIGYKDHIELRSHPTAPRQVKTQVIRKIEVPWVADYDPTTHQPITKMRTKKFPIKVVRFDGGKVVKTFAARSFIGYVGGGVPSGEMVELTEAQVNRLLKRGVKDERAPTVEASTPSTTFDTYTISAQAWTAYQTAYEAASNLNVNGGM